MASKAHRGRKAVRTNKESGGVQQPPPGGVGDAPARIPSEVELAQILSGLIYGVRDGTTPPKIADSCFRGIGRLLTLADLMHKYSAPGAGGAGRVLPFSPLQIIDGKKAA